MNAFERFLAGEDELARLIRSQAHFEPDAEQEARLAAQIDPLLPYDPQSLEFEAPASMEADFQSMMHKLQQDQAPRRDALLQRAAQQPGSSDLPLSPAGKAWLASQPTPSVSAAPTTASTATKSTPLRWWQWGGMILVPALVAGIGMLVFLAQRNEAPNFANASAPLSSPPTELAAAPQSVEPSAAANPAPAPQSEAAQESKLMMDAAPASAPATSKADIGQQANNTLSENARPHLPAKPVPPIAARAPFAVASAPATEPEQQLAEDSAPTFAAAKGNFHERYAPAAESEQRLAMAPAPAIAAAPAPSVAGGAQQNAEVKGSMRAKKEAGVQSRAVLPSSTPLASKSLAQPGKTIDDQSKSAPKPEPWQSVVHTRDDARRIASSLPASANGYLLQVADPQAPSTQSWLAALRQALPPATPLQIETRPALPEGQIRIQLLP